MSDFDPQTFRLISSNHPLKARVLVRETETIGHQAGPAGLIIVSKRKAEMVCGVVLQVGPDFPEPLAVGETVHWRRQFGREIDDAGHVVLDYDHLDAVTS